MIAAGKYPPQSIVIAVAAAAFFFAGSPVAIDPAKGEEARRFNMRIEKGRLAGGLKTIQVRRDDNVEIHWTADRRTIVHLHGYNIETEVDAGASKAMSFRAHASGRFPIETHGEGGRHRVLIYLEVHPR